jgi:hypothetical protein
MFKTVSKPLAHLNFLSGVNCYDIGSNGAAQGTSSLHHPAIFLIVPAHHHFTSSLCHAFLSIQLLSVRSPSAASADYINRGSVILEWCAVGSTIHGCFGATFLPPPTLLRTPTACNDDDSTTTND